MKKIDIYKDDKNKWCVVVDGVDLASAIADGGLQVEFPPYAVSPAPLVRLTLRSDRVNMHLPEAVLEAVKQLDPEVEA